MNVNNNSPVNGGNGSAPPPAVSQQEAERLQQPASQRIFIKKVVNGSFAGAQGAPVAPLTQAERVKQEWRTTEATYGRGLRELVRVIDLALNATDGTLELAIAGQQGEGRAATAEEVRSRLGRARELYNMARIESVEMARILQNGNMTDAQKIDAVELLLGSYAAALANITIDYEDLVRDLHILDSVVEGRVLFPKLGGYSREVVAGLAIMPVQRLPRHAMLLQEYASHTEAGVLHDKVEALRGKFGIETANCNEMKRAAECQRAVGKLRGAVSEILKGNVEAGTWTKVTEVFHKLDSQNFYGDEAAKKEACELRASVFEKNLKRLTGIRGFFARWQIRRLSKRDLAYRRQFVESLEHQGRFIAKMEDKGWMTAQKAAELQRIIARGSGW